MSNSITIFYPSKESAAIYVDYAIEVLGKRQSINCIVLDKGAPRPGWLHVRKFNIDSLKRPNGYMQVFDHANNNTNTDTSLFIAQVYKEIMELEKLVICEE